MQRTVSQVGRKTQHTLGENLAAIVLANPYLVEVAELDVGVELIPELLLRCALQLFDLWKLTQLILISWIFL